MDPSITNGFRIRTLNADCDRLAVQSSVQSTWFCTFRGKLLPKKHDVGLCQNELVVLRPYQGKPVFELEGLGGPHGVLIVNRASGGTQTLRNGQRVRIECDEAIVIKTERFRAPGRDSAGFGAV